MEVLILHDDELLHNGVIGMKWGKRKARINRENHSRLSKDHDKLEKRLVKEDAKAKKYEQFIDKQRRKTERKMMFTFNASKLEKLSNTLDELDSEVIKANRPVKAIQSSIDRNKRMRDTLDKELNKINEDYEAKFRRELAKLDMKNPKHAKKAKSMQKEYDKTVTVRG